MKLQTLEDLLVHQVQDILSAEQQLKMALPRMAEVAGSDKLTSIAEYGVNDAAMKAGR